MKKWICSLILALALALSVPVFAAESGQVRIIDGDTLAFGQVHVRLANIDAPEIRQNCADRSGVDYACGLSARTALLEIINDAAVTCRAVGWDLYGRQVAVCRTRTVPDLAAEMVRRGWAVDYRKYDKGCTYCDIEAEAQRGGKGLWDGKFEMPVQWRIDHDK